MEIMKTWSQCLKSRKNWSLNRIGIIWANPDRKAKKNSSSPTSTQMNNPQTLCTSREITIDQDKDLSKEVETNHLMIIRMIEDLPWLESPVQNQSEVGKNKSWEWTASRNLLKESFCISSKTMKMFCIISISKSHKPSKRLMSKLILEYQISTNQSQLQTVICI